MSKDIDISDLSALSQEDLEYLSSRGRLTQEEETEFLGGSGEVEDDYTTWDPKALKAEVKSRNEGLAAEGLDLLEPESQRKGDLIKALEAYDEAYPEGDD